MEHLLSQLEKGPMSQEMAEVMMEEILTGRHSAKELEEWLDAMNPIERIPSSEELVGFVKAIRKHMALVSVDSGNYMDITGTGGDGKGSFNISTAAAFLTAASGMPVAKTVNRAISSQCGSADVLETLGVNIMADGEKAAKAITDVGIGFFFGDNYYPQVPELSDAMKGNHQTIIHLIRPLLNITNAEKMLLGVFHPELIEPVIYAMRELGFSQALVVSAADGMDEFSIQTKNYVGELMHGQIELYTVDPADYGFEASELQDMIQGDDPGLNAQVMRAMFFGGKGFRRDFAVLNAGAALYIGGAAGSIEMGITMANEAIDSGRADLVLNLLADFTN